MTGGKTEASKWTTDQEGGETYVVSDLSLGVVCHTQNLSRDWAANRQSRRSKQKTRRPQISKPRQANAKS